MKGFTLIELVVTVSIALFITGGIIINYNSYNATQALKQAALTLKNDLRFVQAKAANGEKPTANCPTLTGWTITFAEDTYFYQANCDSQLDSTTKAIVQFVGGIKVIPIPSPNTVTFNVLTHGTDLVVPLDVILTGSGKTYTLEISPSGDISDIGFQQ